MDDQDWKIEIYPPPAPGWPYIVVTLIEGKAPNAQFENSAERAETMKNQIHERLWRAKKVNP